MQVSLPTQYNGKNQEPVGALSSALARLQVNKADASVCDVCRKGTTATTDAVCCRAPVALSAV